jgi:FKBP-type peptidyl-prolyl cis-trans isomerase
MKNYSKILIVALVAIIALGTTGCSKYKGYKKDKKTGMYYKVFNQDKKAAQPVDGDFVEFMFTLRTDDSTIIPTYHSGYQIIESLFKGDFYDALRFMHEKDSISFILDGDSIFKYFMGNQAYPFGEKPLYMDLKLLKITPKEEFAKQEEERRREYEIAMEGAKLAEDSLITNYIKKHNIKVKPTVSGLYFIKTASGAGKKVVKGSSVSIHYKLFTIDDTEIESSYNGGKTFDFVSGEGNTIPGMDEAVQLMKKGDKAKLIIPSKLAYGAGSRQIPPYTTLVFEIELMDVK